MKTRSWFVVALVASILSASSASAQDTGTQDVLPVTLKAAGGQLAHDGATEIDSGTVMSVTVSVDPGIYLAGAIYVSGAASVGDFSFLPSGLVLLGTFDAAGRMHGAFQIDPALAGIQISGRAYAFDGVKVDESPILTLRFL